LHGDGVPSAGERQRHRWPEKHQRDGRWFSREAAAEAVAETGLREAIQRFDAAQSRSGAPASDEPQGADPDPHRAAAPGAE
jgi:hypothetical protein